MVISSHHVFQSWRTFYFEQRCFLKSTVYMFDKTGLNRQLQSSRSGCCTQPDTVADRNRMELTGMFLPRPPCSCCCPTVLQIAIFRENLATPHWYWPAPSITLRPSTYWYVQERCIQTHVFLHYAGKNNFPSAQNRLRSWLAALCSFVSDKDLSLVCLPLRPFSDLSKITHGKARLCQQNKLGHFPVHAAAFAGAKKAMEVILKAGMTKRLIYHQKCKLLTIQKRFFTRPNGPFNWEIRVYLSPRRHLAEWASLYTSQMPRCVYSQWEVCLATLVLLEKDLVRAENISDISGITQQVN